LKRIYIFLLVFFLLGLILGGIGGRLSTPHLNPLAKVVVYLTLPFQKATDFLFSLPYKVVSYFRLNSTLREENRLLAQALEEYKFEMIQMEEQVIESQRLRALLSLKERLPFATVAAEVVGRVPGTHTFLIDKGVNQGVKVGKAVLSPAGLVGQVIKSEANMALVMTITHPSSGVGAMTQTSREMGIVQGRGDEVLVFSFLPPNAKLNIGELIITSGMGGVYPKGIPIGYIRRIHSEVATTSLWAEVEPCVNFNSLEEVLVMR